MNISGIEFALIFCEVNINWRRAIRNGNLRDIICLETHSMSAIRQYIYIHHVLHTANPPVLTVFPQHSMCGIFSLGLVMRAGTVVLLRWRRNVTSESRITPPFCIEILSWCHRPKRPSPDPRSFFHVCLYINFWWYNNFCTLDTKQNFTVCFSFFLFFIPKYRCQFQEWSEFSIKFGISRVQRAASRWHKHRANHRKVICRPEFDGRQGEAPSGITRHWT